jgi:aspartyl protease family protein
MSRVIPVIAVLAVLIMALSFAFPESLRRAGDNGTLIALIQTSMMAILVGAGLFGGRSEGQLGLGKVVQYVAIWIGVALFLVAGYSQRQAFGQLWAGIKGEINPASVNASGSIVTLQKSADGHFWANVNVNGRSIRMMVDTGASDIALDPADATRVGINVEALAFNIPVSTAAGPSRAAASRLSSVAIGPIVRDQVPVLIMQARGGVSLLGMGFLGKLSEVSAQGDVLTLKD